MPGDNRVTAHDEIAAELDGKDAADDIDGAPHRREELFAVVLLHVVPPLARHMHGVGEESNEQRQQHASFHVADRADDARTFCRPRHAENRHQHRTED